MNSLFLELALECAMQWLMAVTAAFAPAHIEVRSNSDSSQLLTCIGIGFVCSVPYLGSESCKSLDLENHFNILVSHVKLPILPWWEIFLQKHSCQLRTN